MENFLSGANIFDFAFMIILIMIALAGMMRGIRTFTSLFGWIFSIQLTCKFEPSLTTIIQQKISSYAVSMFISYAALFIFFLIFFSLLGNIIVSIFSKYESAGVNRAIGFFFGIAKGWFFLSLTLLGLTRMFSVFVSSSPDSILPTEITSSKGYEILANGRGALENFLFSENKNNEMQYINTSENNNAKIHYNSNYASQNTNYTNTKHTDLQINQEKNNKNNSEKHSNSKNISNNITKKESSIINKNSLEKSGILNFQELGQKLKNIGSLIK